MSFGLHWEMNHPACADKLAMREGWLGVLLSGLQGVFQLKSQCSQYIYIYMKTNKPTWDLMPRDVLFTQKPKKKKANGYWPYFAFLTLPWESTRTSLPPPRVRPFKCVLNNYKILNKKFGQNQPWSCKTMLALTVSNFCNSVVSHF